MSDPTVEDSGAYRAVSTGTLGFETDASLRPTAVRWDAVGWYWTIEDFGLSFGDYANDVHLQGRFDRDADGRPVTATLLDFEVLPEGTGVPQRFRQVSVSYDCAPPP